MIKQNTPYKGNDSKLLALKENTSRLVYEINMSFPDKRVEIHQQILPKIFKKLGTNSWFEFPLNCDYGCFTEIGNDCYFNHHLSIGDGGKIKIGNNVWIGANVTILSGVTIGDNAVIGAGSVVTKDIPTNTLAYGVPCKVIRKIK